MATTDQVVLRSVEQHAKLRQSLLLELLKALLGLWGGFKGWNDPDLVSGQAAQSANLVDVALSKSRRLARSYAMAMLRELDAAPAKPLPPPVDLYPRSGSTELDVYTRPAEQYLYAISQGKTDAQALKIATDRMQSLAEMDVAAAERDELETIWALSPKVIGHRRIIHPELSKSGTCGLCVVAASRLYSMDELMPLHNRCKCTDGPVVAGGDYPLRLNEADLKTIYEAAGSTGAADLKRIRVAIKEHGELGPILVREGQEFRDVATVNKGGAKKFNAYSKPTIEQQRHSWEAMKASSERSIKKLEAARASGADGVDIAGTGTATKVKNWAAAIKYHRDLINRMAKNLR